MPRLSLTDFVEVVSKSGTPKATKIKQIKDRPGYHPSTDYYKQAREKIVELHKDKLDLEELDHIAMSVSPKKRLNYLDVVNGYKKWSTKKTLSWFHPPTYTHEKHGVAVNINPELGLNINNQLHVIKLYFKSEPLTKNRVDIITYLMSDCLKDSCQDGVIMSIMDIRRSKLIDAPAMSKHLPALINAELAFIAAMWDEV